MEIRHLKTFMKVAHLLNFNQAAKALNCSQSTVSAQIKLLEEELDVLLFDRLGKKIALTDAGGKLIRYARKMIDIEKETFSEITGNGEPVGEISIRAPQSVGTYLIPEVLEVFRRSYPGAGFNIETCSIVSLKNELRSGIVDVAFLLSDEAAVKGFQTEVLRTEPLVLIAGPGHRLAGNFLRSFSPWPCNGDNQPYIKHWGNRQHRVAPPADGSRNILKEVEAMSGTNVARVTEIIAESPKSFEDAVQVGFARAASTLRGITGLRIVEQRVSVKDNKINTYRVKMEVIFILD